MGADETPPTGTGTQAKRPPGRPPANIDYEKVRVLAADLMSMRAITRMLGFSFSRWSWDPHLKRAYWGVQLPPIRDGRIELEVAS